MDWNVLISEEAVASVLPTSFAAYAQPIRAALTRFLEGLPRGYQDNVVAEQVAAGADATGMKRLAILARSCPTLHKLGQTLARDSRLPPLFRRHLQELESLPPSVAFPLIQDQLEMELGPLDALGVDLVSPALAEGSVAIVAAFKLRAGVLPSAGRCGVFKVLKPGIKERLETELDTLSQVGGYLDEGCDCFQIPHVDYQATFEQVREALLQESRLDLEQRHLREASAMYKGNLDVQIPSLFEYCTAQVTAMERVYGQKITEEGLMSADERRRIADLALQMLLVRPLLSMDPRAIVHGDLHAGNLFYTDDKRLAVLDWSLAATFREPEHVAISQILLGALMLQPDRIIDGLLALAAEPPSDLAGLRRLSAEHVRQICQGTWPGLTWLLDLLDGVITTGLMRVRSDLLLFRKSFHALSGVLADLGVGIDHVNRMLELEFVQRLMHEWPQRWIVPVTYRRFSTRLSTADLTQLVLSLPLVLTRAWLAGIDAAPWTIAS